MPASSTRLTYRECAPPAALRGAVECFWRREPWRLPIQTLGVLPDGRMDVIWSADGKVVVIGPQTRALGRPVPPQFAVVGVRFAPGVGAPLLGLSACELADTHVGLDAIDTRPAASLLRDLDAIESAALAPAVMARAVARCLAARRGADPMVERAAALLDEPSAQVARVADALAISERQLQRRFRESVGYGPKTLQRILRFQRALTELARDGDRRLVLSRAAADAGYADQSHLTRETRALCGLSPRRLGLELRSLRDAGALGAFKTGRRQPVSSGAGR